MGQRVRSLSDGPRLRSGLWMDLFFQQFYICLVRQDIPGNLDLHRAGPAGGQLLHRSPMPAWGLVFSDDEIWDLVAYVASFQPGLLSEPSWPR